MMRDFIVSSHTTNAHAAGRGDAQESSVKPDANMGSNRRPLSFLAEHRARIGFVWHCTVCMCAHAVRDITGEGNRARIVMQRLIQITIGRAWTTPRRVMRHTWFGYYFIRSTHSRSAWCFGTWCRMRTVILGVRKIEEVFWGRWRGCELFGSSNASTLATRLPNYVEFHMNNWPLRKSAQNAWCYVFLSWFSQYIFDDLNFPRLLLFLK